MTFRPSVWPNWRLEELALDACLQPVIYAGDVSIGIFDVLGLEEVLELLHHGVVDGEVAGYGVVGEIVLAEVEEGVVLIESVLEVVRLGRVDLLVGGDAAAAVDGASGVGELDLEVRLVLGRGALVADVVVVVERDVVVVALDEAAGRGVVVVSRQGEAGVLGDLEDGLDEALAEGGLAGDEGAVVVLKCAGDDLGGRGGAAVDEDDDGVLLSLFAVGGAIDLVREGATALRDDDLTFSTGTCPTY